MFTILPNFQPWKEFELFETNMDINELYLCCFQEDLEDEDLEDLPVVRNWAPCFMSKVTYNSSHTLSEVGPAGLRPWRTRVTRHAN